MISQNPKVSIITPSFNQGTYIRQTIESVLSQSYPNIEYWIIDGGSKDGTLGILSSYGDRLSYVSEPDLGQTDAINKGLARTSGDILGFINSDDVLLPNAVQQVVNAFEKNRALWVTGDYRIVDANGRQIHSFVVQYKRLLRRKASQKQLRFANYIAQPSTFWSRALMEKVGNFDITLRYTMDYDYWLRAFDQGIPFVIDNPLSEFRIHGKSKSGSEFSNQFDEELQVLQRYSNSRWEIFWHQAHNLLIKTVYGIIK